jgi:hypothetical protein
MIQVMNLQCLSFHMSNHCRHPTCFISFPDGALDGWDGKTTIVDVVEATTALMPDILRMRCLGNRIFNTDAITRELIARQC